MAKTAPLAGLLLLCFLWSLGSLRADMLPDLSPIPVPRLERLAIPLVLFALASAVLALLRGAQWPRGWRLLNSVLIGIGLFAAPAALAYLPDGLVPDLTRVALFSLTPVFAVVFQPYIGHDEGRHASRGLLAALVAVVGTMCLFPVAIPRSLAAAGAFGAVVLTAATIAAANCLAVSEAIMLARKSLAPTAAIASATAAVCVTGASVLKEHAVWSWPALAPEIAWTAVVELPALLILFWLMRCMSAPRMTSRFVLAPLLTSILGLLALQPQVSLRAGLGLALMAAGAGWLLLAPEDCPNATEFSLTANR